MYLTNVIRTFIPIALILTTAAPAVLAESVVTRISEAYRQRATDSLGALGISRFECRCTFTVSEEPEERFWTFESEPRIEGVDRHGPAKGKLKRGDVIVAIDGILITTREGGKRLANVPLGQPVELTVRRRGSLIDVGIVPAAPAARDMVDVDGLGEPLPEDWQELREALADLSEFGLDLGDLSGTLGILGEGDLDFQPTGWFGFGLSFAGSLHRASDGSGTRWNFDEPPKVESVSEGGPADRAGLHRRDVITHIDGVRLDTKAGGRLFSEVMPGQRVKFKVRRLGLSRSVEIVAEEREEAE